MGNTTGKSTLLIAMFLIMFMLIGYSFFETEEKVLFAVNLDNGEELVIPLEEPSFVLGYTHSVLLTPAEEYFSVQEDCSLLLQKTVYESFGVGLPYFQEEDQDFIIEDGKFILYLEREFEEINMVISPIPDHWIGVGDDRYALVDLATEEGARIRIHIEDRHVLRLGERIVHVF